MNWDQIKGEWKVMKGKARSKWGDLTDDELEEAAGEREKLEGLIQKRYGKTKEQAKEEVDSWMNESA
ncbi:CsbD family protein [Sulfitobacter sp. M57]|uniref:CsbD family protein n=1 Tax=unclassified Sulfitobacter TaxID=196795 RepID=UPI0023E0BA45|nr:MULTISPECIES: CsbD family protein [unclassified Sulfitobacter]MDF3414384.1 CsbD family protein [Sulfitobacter sp. KE5]MDF3420334.1 CsbD family protein [Sulfitobacter sp. KE43]MDF3432930.1 CsbD family protein [Sulfitobacter sp. KE42]MDF3458570.1 CsbD family protein [Sulfitobacter sp. S74]MDF3462470.1 CsbD family protein [Sulfitobacter sp. Ks18]